VKIVATAGKIATCLALVASAARVNVKKPVLGTVRMRASAGEITLAATDLDTAVIATTVAEVLEPGQAAIPHDRFAALVAGFAASTVLTVSTTETVATITAGRATYRLPILAQDILPTLPAITATGEIEMAATDFLYLLGSVAAVAVEETRYFFCGVFLQSVGGNLVAVATDGKRLMRTSVVAEGFSEGRDLVIPTSAITTLRGLLTRTKPKTVTLRRSLRLFEVVAPDFQFVTKLIEPGDTGYPEVDFAIPKPATCPLYCARTDLIAVFRRLSAVATTDAAATLATLSATNGQLTVILSRKPGDAFDHLAAEGDLDRIVVSVRQLASLLDEFDEERVGLEAVSDKSPLVIRAGDKLALVERSYWKEPRMRDDLAGLRAGRLEPARANDPAPREGRRCGISANTMSGARGGIASW
jgi:DNA polymerase III subunit beta